MQSEHQLADQLRVCEQAARAGGQVLLQWRDEIGLRTKGPNDLVTEADLASQRTVREIVLGKFPQYGFIGEEDVERPVLDPNQPCWIVDPLDGTTNFVHGLPTFAVSVALVLGNQVQVGVVYDPNRDECFAARRGGGSTLNGNPLRVSGCERLSDALVACGFPTRVERNSPDVQTFLEVLPRCRSVRRMGSAALNLCYIAAGRLDAYWATSVKSWDVAAGLLIAAEAGATLSSAAGAPVDLADPRIAVSASPVLHKELLATLTLAEAKR